MTKRKRIFLILLTILTYVVYLIVTEILVASFIIWNEVLSNTEVVSYGIISVLITLLNFIIVYNMCKKNRLNSKTNIALCVLNVLLTCPILVCLFTFNIRDWLCILGALLFIVERMFLLSFQWYFIQKRKTSDGSVSE